MLPTTDTPLFPELDTPAVLVDLDVLDRNIAAMADRARRAGVRLRPHTKTHKTAWIAQRQLAAGAAGVTVAKLGEAEVLADAGIRDLLVAYPLVGSAKLRRLRALAERIDVRVALDDVAVAEGTAAVGRDLGRAIPVYVEVDSGLARGGRAPGAPTADVVEQVARLRGLEVIGLMTHAGHAYQARDAERLRQVACAEAAALAETAELLRGRGLPIRELSVGSTPTAFHVEAAAAAYPITEIRPGTYVFNDVNQLTIGVAQEADCALTILATVVGRPAPDRLVLDSGSKTLGGDAGQAPGFGQLFGAPEVRLVRFSEEHAVATVAPSSPWRIGDRVRIIPNHACIPPNLADDLVGVRDGRVELTIPVVGRGKNR